MSDLVTRIWNGPFDAHVQNGGQLITIVPGELIDVTPMQAKENPGWYAPLPSKTAAKPAAEKASA